MLFNRGMLPNFFGLIIVCLLPMVLSVVTINSVSAQDSSTHHIHDTLHYPIHDRRGDFISNERSTFDLAQPSNITDSIGYDPIAKMYIVYEKIGNKYYRTPTSYTPEEFMAMEGHKAETDYFKKRANTLNILNRGQV